MKYARDKGILIGVFSFKEIRNGEAQAAIARAKAESGLQYCYAEHWLESCVPVGLKYYLCAAVDKR